MKIEFQIWPEPNCDLKVSDEEGRVIHIITIEEQKEAIRQWLDLLR